MLLLLKVVPTKEKINKLEALLKVIEDLEDDNPKRML